MNQDVISFGPLDGQVGCATVYLVTAMFVTLPFFFLPKKKFIGKKPTLVCRTNKYAPDGFHHQSRPRVKAMYHPSRNILLLRSQRDALVTTDALR